MTTGLDAQQQIFASNPDDRRAFEALEEHFFLEGDWNALAETYRSRIAAPSIEADPAQQAPLLFRLGQILEERLLDLTSASEVYWTLARLDPKNRPALRQLRGIHESREQWDMVLQIAEIEGATAMPPYERAAFETELGRTWLQHLSDPEEARKAFERALEADPGFPGALQGLAELHQEAERFAEAAQVLEQLTERLRGPERAPIWFTLGTILAGPLEDTTHARKCFGAALDDDPFLTAAVEWSLMLATQDEDWDDVAELLESRFDIASGARHRSAIAVEASQIHLKHLNSPARARAWVFRAEELSSDPIPVLYASADVERADGDHSALLKVLNQLMVELGTKTPQALRVEAAELNARLGNREAALEIMQEAGGVSADSDLRILNLQAELFRGDGRKSELAEVLETITSLDAGASPKQQAGQIRELASLYELDLGDEEAAEVHWRRAFDLDPADEPSRLALERIYRKQDNWSALADTLDMTIEAQGEDAPAELSAQLGQVVLTHFEEPRRARDLFEEALAKDPSSRPALSGLRSIAESQEDSNLLIEVCDKEADLCEDGAQMAALAASAIPILVEGNRADEALAWAIRWDENTENSLAALEYRAQFESDLERAEDEIETRERLVALQSETEQAPTYRRLADLHLQAGNDLASARALENALAGEPGHLDSLTSLSEVYRRLDQKAELARTLRTLADALPDDEKPEILEELSSLLEDPIGDLDAAIAARMELIRLPGASAASSTRLEGLLDLSGRYAELSELLDQRRESLSDHTNDAFDLDLRRGALRLDSLGEAQEAATIFQSLHGARPQNQEVLELLERALRVCGNARGLCDLLAERAENTRDAEEEASIHFERAGLLEESLNEAIEACDVYESITRDFPSAEVSAPAAERLEFLLESSGEWTRLRSLLTNRLDDVPESEKAALRERIVVLCRDRLHDFVGCAEQLEALAETNPNGAQVWQQLEHIYAAELDRPADWLRVVEAELNTEPTADREFALRTTAARLFLDEGRRPAGRDADEALPHFIRVQALDPAHAEATEYLADYYQAQNRPDETARVLEDRLETLSGSEPEERNTLRLRLATHLTTELQDDERARTLFEATRAELGAVAVLAHPLAELFERASDFDAASVLCRDVLTLAEDPSAEQSWRVRLAVSERKAGRPEDAATAYRAALTNAPGDRELEDALCELYAELNETEPLIDLLDERLDHAPKAEKIALHLRLAELHREGRGDAQEALGHLEAVLEREPTHRAAIDQALDLGEEIGDAERNRQLLTRALSMSFPAEERAGLLERRAALLAQKETNGSEEAITDLREAIALDRNRNSARAALRSELEKLGRWPAVLDCLFAEAGLAEGERRIEIYEQASEIARTQLGADASLPWLARLRDERPEDPKLVARLAEVHRRAGRFEAALRAHDLELGLRSDPAEQSALHLQRARLLEHDLAAPSRAIGAYHQALETSTNTAPILEELDRLYASVGRPFDRAQILERRIEELDAAASLPVRHELASLYLGDLTKPLAAVPHLEYAVEQSRKDPVLEMQHLGSLDTALRAGGRWDAWAEVAERELELIESNPGIRESTPDEYERFLREELARVYDDDLGNNERALAQLRVLAGRERRGDSKVFERLRAALRRLGRHTELAEQLGEHLESGSGDATDWLELARLREDRLHDLKGALAAYTAAGEAPECAHEAIRGQRRCAERLRDWDGLAEALEAEYILEDAKLDRRERGALARKLGDIRWLRLNDGEGATRGYRLALDLDDRDREALAATIRVLEATSREAETVPLYSQELALLGDDRIDRKRRVEIHRTLAAIQRDHCDSPEEAIAAFCAAREIERLPAEEELELARLYEATGDSRKFAETLGSWCDREDSPATAEDHLQLADQLIEAGDAGGALARATRATAVAPEHSGAWSRVARLEKEAGAPERATEAFERAAAHAEPREASGYIVEAALCIEPFNTDRARDLLERAASLDPASVPAHFALTRVTSELDRLEDAEHYAETAQSLAANAGAETFEKAQRLEVALLGGRAARALGHRAASRRLFSAVLELEDDQTEALEGLAAAHFEDGEFSKARPLLERRQTLPGENPERASQLSMIARGLEAEGETEAARTHYAESLDLDNYLEASHEGLVRVHERESELDAALDALERWSAATRNDQTRASVALRAADHALALEDEVRARRNLDRATVSDPSLAPAWVMLLEVASRTESEREMRRLCREALDAIEPGPLSAQISLRAARLAEVAGETPEAILRYAEAWRWDPRCREAALCESRLARMSGDWNEADSILSRFIESHPGHDSPTLAHVHLERGRLLSGPLEQFERAITEYERALVLQPDLGVARTALASLLIHAPDRWQEALAVHREILEASPTTTQSLRAVVHIANGRNQPEIAGGALALLRALGQASPEEAALADPVLRFPINPGPPMADTESERLRRIAHQLSEELGLVLAQVPVRIPEAAESEFKDAILQIYAAEDDLTAPRLSQLDADERGALFGSIGALFLDPGGNGGVSRYRDALDQGIGRWTRRKVRRTVEETTLTKIREHDHDAWGIELRTLAAALVIDRNGGDLRSVLRGLILIEQDGTEATHFENAEIGTLVATSETARRLLARITSLLCERLESSR
ncbi:MAG: tetratricopeptide repeat protein [Myxococcota bacterium]